VGRVPATRVFNLEPQRTAYDLHFKVTGIPARVHPLFWLCMAIMAADLKPPLLVLLWVGVTFVSILIHELGHAWAARACGWVPHIVLYQLGGLAIYRPDYVAPYRQVGISLAGPGAGFILAGFVLLFVVATGHSVLVFNYPVGWGSPFANPNLEFVMRQMMHVNLTWGLVNLLPIFPLDGGRVASELWSVQDPIAGMRKTLVLSVVTGVIAAVLSAFYLKQWFPTIFFAVLAGIDYLNLRQITAAGGFGGYGDNYGGGGSGYDDGYEDRGGRGW